MRQRQLHVSSSRRCSSCPPLKHTSTRAVLPDVLRSICPYSCVMRLTLEATMAFPRMLALVESASTSDAPSQRISRRIWSSSPVCLRYIAGGRAMLPLSASEATTGDSYI